MMLRYASLALAFLLPLAASAAPCSETDGNGNNADDILQGDRTQAILFGTNPTSNIPQELGQSFEATCDGNLEFFRVLYNAPDANSAGVVISGNAILFEGVGTTGTVLATTPFTFTLAGDTDLRPLQADFTGVPVTQGSAYTVFFDITSGDQVARLQASTGDTYTGGSYFSSNTGSADGAGSPGTNDLTFRARFRPTPVASEEAAQSRTVSLLPTRPNPAAASTLVPFTLREAADVRLAVYDALGRQVALVAERAYASGEHAERVDVSALAPGTYVVRLEAGADVVLRTIAVAR